MERNGWHSLERYSQNTYMLTLYEQTDLIDGEELLLKHMENVLELVNNELLKKDKYKR